VSYVGAPAYFGEWECLFDVPERVAELLAGSESVVYVLQEQEFLDLLSYQVYSLVSVRVDGCVLVWGQTLIGGG
jgi:hypothetical protein